MLSSAKFLTYFAIFLIINIKNKGEKNMCIEGLQLMCNPNILDKRKTTATLFPGSLSEVGISMPHDMDCEGNRSCFHNIFKDGDIYRMYYLGWKMGESIRYIRVCYAESVDGVTWVKPNLGICEFNGNKNNNVTPYFLKNPILLDLALAYSSKTTVFCIRSTPFFN